MRIVRILQAIETTSKIARGRIGDFGPNARHFTPQQMTRQASSALDGLQGDIAGEAFHDHDIHVAGEYSVRFDEARIGNARIVGKQPRRVAHDGRALVEFGTDVEQRHVGARSAGGVGCGHAHQGVAMKLRGVGAQIGTEIQHSEGAVVLSREALDDRGPTKAGQQADQMSRQGHQCAGAAGAHQRIGVARGHCPHRGTHGRIEVAAQRRTQRIFGGQASRRVDRFVTAAANDQFDDALVTKENQGGSVAIDTIGSIQRSVNQRRRGRITAKRIDGYADGGFSISLAESPRRVRTQNARLRQGSSAPSLPRGGLGRSRLR